MSQLCAIQDCKRASRTLCHCCNQNLCRDHFNEHDDLLNSQLNPLADVINALADRLAAINIDKLIKNSREKLDQWRLDCHKRTDQCYEEKCEELDRYANKNIHQLRKTITDLRAKMSELIEKQETTRHDIDSLTSDIRTSEQQMNEIERFCIQVGTRPLIIDKSLVQIGRSEIQLFHLSNLSSPYRTINGRCQRGYEITSNDQFLLVCIGEVLHFIGQDLSIVKQIKWIDTLGDIRGMCWSSVLRRFIVMSQNHIVSINENELSLEPVLQVTTKNLFSCACSNKSLYLSRSDWDSSVFEYTLLPSTQSIRVWKTTHDLNREQCVEDIKCNNETLALIINDRSTEANLMELRSLETFSTLWSISIDLSYSEQAIRCCLLTHDEWLLADWCTSHLFYIADGQVKKKTKHVSTPYNINLFRSNILAIITDDRIDFHKL